MNKFNIFSSCFGVSKHSSQLGNSTEPKLNHIARLTKEVKTFKENVSSKFMKKSKKLTWKLVSKIFR